MQRRRHLLVVIVASIVLFLLELLRTYGFIALVQWCSANSSTGPCEWTVNGFTLLSFAVFIGASLLVFKLTKLPHYITVAVSGTVAAFFLAISAGRVAGYLGGDHILLSTLSIHNGCAPWVRYSLRYCQSMAGPVEI